jgi:sugar lactone lactonase YvrE
MAIDRLGNAFVSDTNNHTIRRITPAGEVTTFAGTPGLRGDADGSGAAARFNYPAGVAVDGEGNLYIADEGSHTIRKITPSAEVTTFAGLSFVSGSLDGARSVARFRFPTGVEVDSLGNIYVADTGNQTIRIISSTGQVSTRAGLAGNRGTADGIGAAARFDDPRDLAIDANGNVYVADAFNHAIRRITASGEVTTFAGVAGQGGSDDGNGNNARLQAPSGIAIDANGTFYVAESGGQRIRRITASRDVTTIAGLFGTKGHVDGTGTSARFNFPGGIAIDASDGIWVADTNNHAIRIGVLTTIGPKRRAVSR